MTTLTEQNSTTQSKIPKSKGKLQNRITLLLIAVLIPILVIYAWYDITTQQKILEALILERAESVATSGAATIANSLERAIENGELTREEAFDTNYVPFWEFDPTAYPEFDGDPSSLTKYHTAYDEYTDEHWQELIDSFLGGEDLIFAAASDRNGYVPTHNTISSSGDGNPATDRTKRIFDDPVGLKASRNTEPVIQQIYTQSGTDDTFWDVSAPIYVDGEHWGAFRVGVALSQNQQRVIEATWQTVLALGFVVALIAIFSLVVGRYISAPIVELTTAATLTASGNLNQQLNIQNRQEITTLAQAFNSMTMQLRDLIGNLENRVNARTQDLNLAADIGRQITQARNIDDVLVMATTSIQKQFSLYQVQIYLVDRTGRDLILRASDGFAGSRILETGHHLRIDEYSLNGSAAYNKQAVIVADTKQEAQFLPHPLLPDTRSEMVVPIMLEDDVLGVMDLQSDEANSLTEEILPAFSVLAGQLAIAIINARQNRTVQQNQRLMRTIIDASPDWIFVKNQEHRYQLVNQAYADSLHMTPEDFINKNDLDLGFPEDIVKGNLQKGIQGFWADDQEVMDSKQMKRVPEEPGEVDGKPVVLQTVKAPLINDDGETTGVVGFVHDITDRKQAELTIAKRADELQAVAELSTAVTATVDPQKLLLDVSNLAKERFNLYHAHIYLFDENKENLVLTAGAGEAGRIMVEKGVSIPLHQEQSLVARAARSGKGVIVNDVMADPGFLANPLLPHTGSEMAVPMIAGNEILGVFDVQANDVDHFTNEDIQIQTTLAAQTAVALQNARQSQQIRAALQEADNFRRLVEATHQGVGIADAQGTVYYTNQALAHMVDHEANDLLGNQMFGLYPPDIQLQFQEEIIPAVLEFGQWEGELRIFGANGEEIPTFENYFILPDEDGNPTQIAAIITNMSEQKATEEAIRANQTLMQIIINSTPDWIFAKDREHKYQIVNQSYASLLNRSPEDFIDKNDLELGFPEELIKGDPEKGIRGIWDDDIEVMETGETKEIPENLVNMGGKTGVMKTLITPLKDEEDNTIGIVGFSQDITERKKAEQEQAQLAQELQEQLEQVNALQRAMTREGWQAFLINQQRAATGFAYSATANALLAFDDNNMPESLRNIPFDLNTVEEISISPTQTAVNVPLKLHGESIGVIGARTANGEPINEEQQTLLATLTEQVAEALDRARLFEETETARSQTEALFSGSQQVVGSTNAEEILYALVQATSLKDRDSVSLLFFDRPWQTEMPENVEIIATWESGRSDMRLPPIDTIYPLNISPLAPFLDREKPFTISDINTDPRISDEFKDFFLKQFNIQSFIAIPLLAGGQWLGFVSGTSYEPYQEKEQDVLQIISLAGQAAAVAQSQRLYEQAAIQG